MQFITYKDIFSLVTCSLLLYIVSMKSLSDQELLVELGQRIKRIRLQQNLTQAQIAERSGLSIRTVSAAEAGDDVRLSTLIKLLRVLGRLGGLDAWLPSPQVSPLELVERQGKQRRRARRKRVDHG